MIRILGPTPMAVAEKALALKNALLAGGKAVGNLGEGTKGFLLNGLTPPQSLMEAL